MAAAAPGEEAAGAGSRRKSNIVLRGKREKFIVFVRYVYAMRMRACQVVLIVLVLLAAQVDYAFVQSITHGLLVLALDGS